MADGGCPDGLNFPEIDIVVLDSSYARALLGYFTKQWQEILGIKVSASFRNYGTFFQEIEAIRPNMWMTGWRADYPDPDSFLRYDPWLQQSGWRNEQYEMLVSDARGIRDQESRMALYKQAEMILVEEAPVVPIHYGRQQLLVQPWVPAIRASIITGNIPKDIIIEPH
jgi:oligopeptide transport system substrate-binding protein